MSNRRFLEDNENIQGEGKATHYAAPQDNKQKNMTVEEPTTFLDWMGIFGMMLITYLTIVLIWVVCMYGIQTAFTPTVIIFIVLFIIYIGIVGLAWHYGLQHRVELIDQMIQQKLRDQAVEIGSAH